MQHLRQLYPDLLAPDFPGDFWQRMARLEQVIGATGRLDHRRLQHGRTDGGRLCLPAPGPGGQAGARWRRRWPSSTWPRRRRRRPATCPR
ncbi:MAG: hypothetical protein V9H69_19705 [Anaerolineae bacterium]